MDPNDVILEECKRKFGAAPRQFPFLDGLLYLRSGKPAWCTHKDKLSLFFEGQSRLYAEGRVVWGHIIQVNRMLFSPGPYNSGGEVVYCLDHNRQGVLQALGGIGPALFALKGKPQSSPELATISEYLYNEHIRVFGLEVPRLISGDLPCAISSVFFNRKHLPNRVLSKPCFPIVVSKQNPRLAAVVPSRYWPASMLDWWLHP